MADGVSKSLGQGGSIAGVALCLRACPALGYNQMHHHGASHSEKGNFEMTVRPASEWFL